MAIIRLQNEFEKNVYYEYDSSTKPLGEGGMGRVFQGRRIETNSQGVVLRERDVAVKCMFDNLPEHVIMRARREASIRIKSLNLVEMVDFVELHKGPNVYYHVVSELLNGVNLDELMEGHVDNHDGSPNPFAKKLLNQYQQNRKAFVGTVFRGLLSGISVLHDQGYIHRDIDPSNIMITSNGDVKLIDFGIAKKIDDLATTDKQLTSDGQFAGKVCYAAPELVLGDLKHQDNTTDIYALGITLYQLVTGHLPFEGSFAEVYKKQINDELPLKEIDDKMLRSIIEKATDKKQRNRYQSAAEFRVAIDEWMAGINGHDDNKKKKTVIGIVVALIVVLVILLGSGAAYLMYEKQKEDKDKIEILVKAHKENVETCDMRIAKIVRDGKVGDTDDIKEALKSLQEIEKKEKDPYFQKSGAAPVFSQEFQSFKDKLNEAERLVNNKYQWYIQQDLEDNIACSEQKERLDLIHDILQQAEQGSAVAIVPQSK